MSRAVFQPSFETLPGSLPIFPLAGVLLLPGGQLPLNVFEPRYLAMVRDALAGSRLIGMIQPALPAGAGGDVEELGDIGAAPVYETGCAGRITAYSETDDGRNLITLTGVIRFDVARELPGAAEGYRLVEPRYDRFRHDLESDEAAIDRAGLLDALEGYFGATGIEGDWSAIEEADDEPLVTSLAMLCPFAAPEKQALLEAMTLPERAATMTTIMAMAAHQHGDAPPAPQ